MDILREKLERNIARIADEFPGVMGIAVKDLSSGDELLVNADEIFPIASSIKVAILIEFFKKVEKGAIKPSELLTFRREQRVSGSGVLKELGEETVTMSLLDYATLMITVSDNSATNICIDLVGMEEINETLAQLGLKTTRLVRRMMDLDGLIAGRENISTPREMVQLMDALHGKRGLSPWVCERTLEMLKKPKEGILEGVIRNAVPDNISVADKSGWVEGAACDVGIVYLPKRPYAAAIMAKHIPASDPKGLRALESMTLVTKLVHEHFTEIDSATPYGRRIEG
jgi:beta-lactamase class A